MSTPFSRDMFWRNDLFSFVSASCWYKYDFSPIETYSWHPHLSFVVYHIWEEKKKSLPIHSVWCPRFHAILPLRHPLMADIYSRLTATIPDSTTAIYILSIRIAHTFCIFCKSHHTLTCAPRPFKAVMDELEFSQSCLFTSLIYCLESFTCSVVWVTRWRGWRIARELKALWMYDVCTRCGCICIWMWYSERDIEDGILEILYKDCVR